MADTNGTYRVQYAALPYRVRQDGEVQLRLVTSRETRRWVIPKGWPMKGIPPHKAAAREAYEEAGLLGSIASTPLGIYRYDKRLSLTRSVLCEVMVFPMKVKRYLKKWPERSQRVGFWFSIETAASVVQEPELASLILEFGAVMAERHAQKLADLEAVAQAKSTEASPKKKAAPKKAVAKKAEPDAPEAKAPDKPTADAVAPRVEKAKPAKAKPAKAKAAAEDPAKVPAKAKPAPKDAPKAKAAAKAKSKAKAAAPTMGLEATIEAVIPPAEAPAVPADAAAEKAPAKKVRVKKAKGGLDVAAQTASVTGEPAPPAKTGAKTGLKTGTKTRAKSKSKAKPATSSPAKVMPSEENGAPKDAGRDAPPAKAAARKTAPVKKKAAARKPENA